MPLDLVSHDVLDLVSVREEDDFVEALTAKSRLGRFVA